MEMVTMMLSNKHIGKCLDDYVHDIQTIQQTIEMRRLCPFYPPTELRCI